MAKFEKLNAQVLGISVDHVPCLKAWAESLGGISFPLLSDFSPQASVAKKYGVRRKEGFSERAIFVLDKFGIIRYFTEGIFHHDTDGPEEANELERDIVGNDLYRRESGELRWTGTRPRCEAKTSARRTAA